MHRTLVTVTEPLRVEKRKLLFSKQLPDLGVLFENKSGERIPQPPNQGIGTLSPRVWLSWARLGKRLEWRTLVFIRPFVWCIGFESDCPVGAV